MQQISASELADWLKASSRQERPPPVMVDVREPWELEICRIEGAVALPMGSIPTCQTELDPDADTVVICHHGVRSYQVALFLERNDFSSVFNLTGGIDAWAHDVDPAIPTY